MEVGLATAGLVIGASSARSAAKQQNSAIRRSAASTQEAANVSAQQVTDAAQLEKRKIALRTAQVAGTIRAAGATSGQGMSGSFGALSRQNAVTAAENFGVIDMNLENQIAAIKTGAQAQVDRLSAGLVNQDMATFTGGFGGLQTGLQIVGALGSINDYFNTPEPVDRGPNPVANHLAGIREL